MSETPTKDAGRELDALVAEKVMGWVWMRSETAPAGWRGPNGDLLAPWRWLISKPLFAKYRGVPAKGNETRCIDNLPPFSTDITAAWMVLEALERDPRNIRATITSRGFIGCTYRWCPPDDPEGNGYVEGWTCELRDCGAPFRLVELGAPTAPLAICRAALLAVEAPAHV